MKRPGAPLTLEILLEESKFILRTLQRKDLFGEKVSLTEAERVLDHSISLNFGEYRSFLERNEYIAADNGANEVRVTEQGDLLAKGIDEASFQTKLARYFAKELESSSVPSLPPEPVPPPSVRSTLPAPSSVRARPSSSTIEDILDRRFKKEALLAEGPIATVFKGRHLSLGRVVAIKEAKAMYAVATYLRRDEVTMRWRARVEAAAQLAHPFILPVLDQNAERDVPYVVTDLASGSLRTMLDASTEGIALPDAARVLLQAAEALRYAHSAGVLHLGLKPENLLVDGFGNVRVSDFGMSTITERPVAETAQASSPPIMVGGSVVPYLAPERLTRDSSEATPATDVYALGMLAYEVLVGRLPGRRSPMPSEARPGVPSGFDDVFDRMTRDGLDERYPDLEATLSDLRPALVNLIGGEQDVPVSTRGNATSASSEPSGHGL
ncbi:MAG: serine/threonine-protein kinase [Myxococcota bacterium]